MRATEAAVLRQYVARLLALDSRKLTPIVQLKNLADWIDACEVRGQTDQNDRDGERLEFVEKLLLTCPGARIQYVDPDDAERDEAGFSITVDGCDPVEVDGKESLRDAIDAAYVEFHQDIEDSPKVVDDRVGGPSGG